MKGTYEVFQKLHIITENKNFGKTKKHMKGTSEVFQKLHIPTENKNFGTFKCLLLHKFYSVERL